MTPAAKLARARELHRAGEQRAAIQAYHDVLAAGAPALEAHLGLGELHSDLGEHEAAATHLRAVLEREPSHADALCLFGTVMSDLGRYGEAASMCRRALEARPAFPEAHYNLGLALFELGELDAARRAFERCAALRRGEPWSAAWPPPSADPLPAEESAVNWIKVKHDAEQLAYLLELGRLPAPYGAVLDQYRALLDALGTSAHALRPAQVDAARFPLVAVTYKRPLYVADEAVKGPVVNPDLDWNAIQRDYLARSPSVISVDGLLSAEGLAALRRFCRESCIWNDLKAGYLGAYLFDGFSSSALLRLAQELRARMPRVIGDLPLQMMWGYKYESALAGTGIGLHADAAAVNVNLWLTEDDANLDPRTGGLLVHAHEAPPDWGFAKFNRDVASIERELGAAGTPPLRVPHRANRAVIFDSDLFHATDAPRFREGYLNRRINVTLLYGLRCS